MATMNIYTYMYISMISQLADCVHNKKFNFVQYKIINPITFDPKTFITVVMTTHNRKEQTLYTLQTIAQSSIVSRVLVIIVDDSTENLIRGSELQKFPFQISHITIDSHKKTWINPCINYNIGLAEVKTDRVVIQNAEVFHCGDILQYVDTHLMPDNYLVFDVRSVGNSGTNSTQINHEVYQLHTYSEIYTHLEQRKYMWYQHSQHSNRNFHFLTAIMRSNLTKLDGFAYEFAMGSCFDDDGLLYGIRDLLDLKICNVSNEDAQLMGVHQWHPRDPLSYNPQYHRRNNQIWLDRAFYQNVKI